MNSIAVIGASLAGLRSAEALRASGFDGRLIMVGAEPHRPYDRPPLSKDFLLGRATDIALARPEDDEALAAEWRLGVRAERLDSGSRTVTLSGGSELTVDGVVIATGGTPRKLRNSGDIEGVLTLRTKDDAEELRKRLLAGPEHVVVVGAGFLGAEVAASCHAMGRSVTVVEALPVPMAAAIGPEMGAVCAGLHADNGVTLITGHGVGGLVAIDGRVRAVRLDDGRALPAELVVVAIGIVPATDWLADSGLALDNGVVTDAGWCTAVPGVVAVGDVARHDCVSGPARHEHWTNAAEQARVAAGNLLAGKHLGHCPGPGYFWSDQYGVRIQFAGSIRPTDEVRVVEGSVDDRKFLATYHRDGRTTGALAMNLARAFVRARRRFATTTEEDDRCPTCSSTATGGAR